MNIGYRESHPDRSAASMRDALLQSHRGTDPNDARNGDRDLFIAILAHELRDPLVPLKNLAHLLKKDNFNLATIARAAEIIDRQVLSMTRLIDDLLEISRLRLGSFQLRCKRVSLGDIVEATVEATGPLLAAHGHSLIVDVPAEPIVLDADEMRLSQVLRNLIGNAAKYTNPGGQIRLEVRRDGTDAVLTISDTGIGIEPASLQSIFEPYEQVGQAATARSEGGLGIGLYLAKSFVEAHGGTIRAVSAGLGLGSKFIVRLPSPMSEEIAASE